MVAGLSLTAAGYAQGMVFDRTQIGSDLNAPPVPGEAGQ
jgi:hypothetical protein